MENFTPFSGFAGGVLIGLASVALLLSSGRIAGISGIMGGLLPPERGDAAWRGLLLAGLIIGVLAHRWASGDVAAITIDASYPLVVLGGLLVGFGTRMGGGCTSGHGVCGIGRLSQRSIAATAVFIVAAGLTVFVVRHLLGG